ncbi:MAG: class I SAM-dependent methyltransferase [Planctomycetes bacterium]|nr:class I SAM-dependent methyltransferase [Planctomycetota bacterium]
MPHTRLNFDPARLEVATGDGSSLKHDQAVCLAKELGLPFHDPTHHLSTGAELLLLVTGARLELREPGRRIGGPVYVDFVGGATGYRRRSGRSRDQAIGRAIGLRSGAGTVVDATAGLCRDAFLLACLGCRVTAIERSAVVAALVRDGLARARAESKTDLNDVLDRITLVVGDAREALAGMTGPAAPDVVYLDPMYSQAGRSALAKKEMRILRRLVGDDSDAPRLLEAARNVARRRVVVKRHRHAPPLAETPALKFLGRSVRYDVYLPVVR